MWHFGDALVRGVEQSRDVTRSLCCSLNDLRCTLSFPQERSEGLVFQLDVWLKAFILFLLIHEALISGLCTQPRIYTAFRSWYCLSLSKSSALSLDLSAVMSYI